MGMRRSLSITALCLVCLLIGGCGPEDEPSDPTSSYYAADHVLDVDIELAPEDWETLRSQTRTLFDILGGDCLGSAPDDIFSFFPATVTVDGETHTEVGVRKKGFLGSLSYEKPSLKIRFDKFVDDQLLGGVLKRVTLNNVQQDSSRLNTCLSYKVFADAGMPSPRCNFARVSVNGQDMGLYVHVESIKRAFLERSFDNADGNLYEGTISDFRTGWQGTFQKKNNEEENDWSDIEAVTNALEDPSPAGLEALAEVVDIDRFLTFWALEVMVGHWDGYAGNRNNYYIYRETDGRFVFIPWGPDSSFSYVDYPFDDEDYPQSVMAKGGIAHRLYQDPTHRDRYLQRLEELIESNWNELGMLDEIDRMSRIVQEHALPDTLLEAQADTERVRDHVIYRRNQILGELSPEPQPWDWPLDPPDICWGEVGLVDLAFEASWGTLGGEPITSFGDVDVNSYIVNGQPLSIVSNGATAGIETQGEAAGQAAITIGNILADGTADILAIYTSPELIYDGSTLSFDDFSGRGFRVLVPPPYTDSYVVGFLGAGELQLELGSTKAGGTLSGHLQSTIYGTD